MVADPMSLGRASLAQATLTSSTHPLLQRNPWSWDSSAGGWTSFPFSLSLPFSVPDLCGRVIKSVVWRSNPLLLLTGASGDEDQSFADDVFLGLAATYGLVGFIALVQLIRIQLRVPEYGWTTQKVFHLLNFVVNAIRCAVFSFRIKVEDLQPKVVSIILLDLPGLLFFTTYMLLVLFWAEIYHQARGLATENLRPTFRNANIAVYVVQASLWGVMYFKSEWEQLLDLISKCFFASVSLAAAVGFLLYGGRLFLMLRRFPIESRGRRKKLQEVGLVTFICFTCFTIRACMIVYTCIKSELDLDMLKQPILDAAYYSLVELIPSALVLFILRKLPPRRNPSAQVVR